MAVKHVDLFAGIGGFSIAAARVGWETVAYCETDEFCRRVLERHIDRVRRISLPGSLGRRPEEGPGGFAELPGLDPDWIVIENVGHTWRKWVPELRRRLLERGYASLPFRVRASDVGAPHERARVFVVANADSEQLRELSRWWERSSREVAAELKLDGAQQSVAYAAAYGWHERHSYAGGRGEGAGTQAERRGSGGEGWWLLEPDVGRVAHGVPDQSHRLKALGNAVVPQAAELVFRGIEAVLSGDASA